MTEKTASATVHSEAITLSLFEQGTRYKLTFESGKGQLSIEDLWDLPLTTESKNGASLNSVAQAVYAKLQSAGSVNFVNRGTSKNKDQEKLEMGLEIVKRIIAVKEDDNARARRAQDKAKRRHQIYELLAQKDAEADKQKTPEQLLKELESLEDE
jgi:hypothetical protein